MKVRKRRIFSSILNNSLYKNPLVIEFWAYCLFQKLKFQMVNEEGKGIFL